MNRTLFLTLFLFVFSCSVLLGATAEIDVTAVLTETNMIKSPQALTHTITPNTEMRKFGVQIKGAPSSMIQVQYIDDRNGKREKKETDYFLNLYGKKNIQIQVANAPSKNRNIVVQLNY